jgi:hypothetical protein
MGISAHWIVGTAIRRLDNSHREPAHEGETMKQNNKLSLTDWYAIALAEAARKRVLGGK